jgi:2-keto-4-pentenoate hydratase/2-oxohepta-3-ene-1,7-dioic acid hydratase in catechol pathway
MKLVTFQSNNSTDRSRYRIGALASNEEILDLTDLVSRESLTATELLNCFDLESGFLNRANDSVDKASNRLNRSGLKICAPVPRPGKIICIGLNYRDHAAESGMAIPSSPVIFSKFSTCAIGPSEPIRIPNGSTQTDYEAELAFVIGRRASDVRTEDALNYVLGYTNFNDVSARDFQFADGQWQRGKSCDTFAPMGEFIATRDEIPDPQNRSIKFRLNSETLQDSNTNQMIFGVAELVEFLSRYIILEPGDVVATGTPPGVGFARKPPMYLKEGDVAEVEIEGLGVLSNPVVAAAAGRHPAAIA